MLRTLATVAVCSFIAAAPAHAQSTAKTIKQEQAQPSRNSVTSYKAEYERQMAASARESQERNALIDKRNANGKKQV